MPPNESNLSAVPNLPAEGEASQSPVEPAAPELVTNPPGMDPIAPEDSQEPNRDIEVVSTPGDPGYDDKVNEWSTKVAANQAKATPGETPVVPLFTPDTDERQASAQRHPSNPRPVDDDQALSREVEAAAIRVVDGRGPNQIKTEQQMGLSAAARKNSEDAGLPPPTADLR